MVRLKRLITYQNYPIITDILICDSNFRVDVCDIITAAINTRDFAKTMVKVRSSNIWGYNIDIKDNDADTGDVPQNFRQVSDDRSIREQYARNCSQPY